MAARKATNKIADVENSETEAESDEESEYEVEKILSCRISTDGTLYYLIRWKGYGPEEDTWEPEENLLHCKDVIREFFDHGDDVPKSYISEVIHINEDDFKVLRLKSSPPSPDTVKSLRITPERRKAMERVLEEQTPLEKASLRRRKLYSTYLEEKHEVTEYISSRENSTEENKGSFHGDKRSSPSKRKYLNWNGIKQFIKNIVISIVWCLILSLLLLGILYGGLIYDLS